MPEIQKTKIKAYTRARAIHTTHTLNEGSKIS